MSDEWVMVPREASEAMIRAGYSAPTVFGVRDMANTYRAMLAAAPDASQRNREADRARYIDRAFNEWLDDSVADGGATVWDLVPDIHSAWAAWTAHPHYAAPQQVEPVAWMAFGGSIVHAVTRNAMDPIEAERFDVPLYLHPPADEVQQADTCPTCGSDCNERDELEKAEREIERLRRAPARPEDMAAFAAELKADPVKALAFFQSAGILNERGELTPEYAAPQQADAAYTERNHLVALLSKLYPAGKARTAIEGWSPEWHGCVYIDFPWGQASWHYHDRDAGLFNHLEPYRGSWDGHTTEAKYELIRQAVAAPRQAEAGPGRHWWPVSKGHADNVCAAAPQQAEPVAWMAFGGSIVHAVTRNAMDPIEAERFDVPLYLHPPAAPQQAEPVEQIGWADEFGNLFPMGAWKPAQRTHHDAHKTAWRAVYLHPPADEVQRLRDALRVILEADWTSDRIRNIARKALEGGA